MVRALRATPAASRPVPGPASWLATDGDRLYFVTREDPAQTLWSWDGAGDPEAITMVRDPATGEWRAEGEDERRG